jgi:maltooligosyltrehalose trehalohydrolase
MLFQGEEFGASSPFLYFADHEDDLMKRVYEGRCTYLTQFASLAAPGMVDALPDPGDPSSFIRSKLDHTERVLHAEIYALHGDLLRLRREDAVFRRPRLRGVDGATLNGNAFVLRYFGDAGDDRLLLINLGAPMQFRIQPEPLLAPSSAGAWQLLWSSEDIRYGGLGLPQLSPTMCGWQLPGDCAVVLAPTSSDEH